MNPTDYEYTHGRCTECGKNVVYRWLGKPLLKNAMCPAHRTPLKRTALALMKHPELRTVQRDVDRAALTA